MMSDNHRDRDTYLRIYLNDHRAGSVAGKALAARCRSSNSGTPLASYLTELLQELDEDSAIVDALMSSENFAPNPAKLAFGKIAEVAGRLKFNGHLQSYSPLSRLLELEALIAGVRTRQRMWRAFQAAGVMLPTGDLATLADRADRQVEVLERFHSETASSVFGTDDSTVPTASSVA